MRTAVALAAGGVVAGLLATPLAVAGEPAPEIVGVRYSVAATGPATLSSAGNLEVGAKTRIGVRGAVPGATFVADATAWELEVLDARSTLVLTFRVRTTSDPSACPEGARGTVTAVDDDRRHTNGRTRDIVRVRFRGGKCGRFVRAWTNAGGERRARVEIQVEPGP
jgi:hypothetical protein